MSDQKGHQGNRRDPGADPAAADRRAPHPQLVREREERSERLADALRQNLKRRKQQGRARADGQEGG
jgi:hypothetical protein